MLKKCKSNYWCVMFFARRLRWIATRLEHVSMSPEWSHTSCVGPFFYIAARECPLSLVYSWHFDEVHWAYNAIAHSEVIVINACGIFMKRWTLVLSLFHLVHRWVFACVRAYYFICIVANDYTQRMHSDNGIAFDSAVLLIAWSLIVATIIVQLKMNVITISRTIEI